MCDAELAAMHIFSPTTRVRLCYFHVTRNIFNMVKASRGKKDGDLAVALLDRMSTLSNSVLDRKIFLECVRLLLRMFPSGNGVLDAAEEEEIVAALAGAFGANVARVTVVYRSCTCNTRS